ncbi:MAG: hypothetical protein HY547_02560 [Elusimicrobia bacterium]|nr:hypothetical protein [Elusimicrobiota bacterium]
MTAVFVRLLFIVSALWADDYPHDAKAGLISPGSAFIIYYDGQGPLNFDTLTPGSLPADARPFGSVQGRSCQYGVSIPFNISYPIVRSPSISSVWGNSSLKKIINAMTNDHPGLKGIYDAQIDKHTIQVLGIFTRLCIEVTAKGFR